MAEKEEIGTIRKKLTLKLKLPEDATALSLTKPVKQETFVGGRSRVEVAIRGRRGKAENGVNVETSNLSKDEIARRQNLLRNLSSEEKSDIKHDLSVLEKIKSSKIKAQEDKVESTEDDLTLREEESIKDKLPESKVAEQVEDEIDNKTEIENIDELSSTHKGINVRDKIKQSLIEKQREEEKRKKIKDAKEAEEKKLKEEREERLKKIKKTKTGKKDDFVDDGEEGKKTAGIHEKKEKHTRRNLKTFVIGNTDDDEESYLRRKARKQKVISVDQEKKKIAQEVILPEFITVSQLAERMAEKTSDVVKKLFSMGMVATVNQTIDADTAELIVQEFGHTTKRVTEADVETSLEQDLGDLEQKPRAPIVTIMGHVDHGKTSLLDALRSSNVVAGESGGITQHIGASRVDVGNGKFITFIDTPGHEAFTEMRLRGANATDIVVLVVAADDGVKDQTVEAINHARAANVPIIVAINKIDKPEANPSMVENELLNYSIVSEKLGGDVMFVEVSAKSRTNLDKLMETILLQAEILELKAPTDARAEGVVIEARKDVNKGIIVSLLVRVGTLKVGDIVVAGTAYGKVRKMLNDKFKNQKEATPSMAVEVMGFNSIPAAGEKFAVVSEEKQARDIVEYREKKERDFKAVQNSKRTVGDLFRSVGDGKIKELPLIIKADVHGSIEALSGSLMKLNTDEVAIRIIHSATGGINESDVNLASVSNAMIIGFNVRANVSARDLAKNKGVEIRYYSIIYNVVDEIKAMLGGLLEPTKREEVLGHAEIRQVFKVSGVGKIAGSFVTDGMIQRNALARLLRDSVVIHSGKIKTLKRQKEDVKEVKHNLECGIAFENYEDIKEGDVIECYKVVEETRSL